MPNEAQVLYFHLCMNADDDGIVEAYTILKQIGVPEDNFRVLIARQFVVPLNEDDVTFILDWHEHNLIRPDRKVDSIYKELLVRVVPHAHLIEQKPRADTGKPTGRPVDNQWTAQVRLGEVRLGEGKDTDSVPYAPEFLTFWEAYPKKTGKGEAWKSWQKLRPSKSLAEKITAAVRQQAASNKAWKREEGRFIPNPATFLNQRRWEDEQTTTAVTNKYANL
jgi:hypothetical protein